MSSKLYYTAMEIAKLLDVSRTKAYDICRELNEELEEEELEYKIVGFEEIDFFF